MVEVALGQLDQRPGERRHAVAHDHAVEPRGLHAAAAEQVGEQQPELVTRGVRVGVQTEVRDQHLAVEHPGDDVRVADVQRQEHRGECRWARAMIAP